MSLSFSLAAVFVRLHYPGLASWIVFSLPSSVLFGLQFPAVLAISAVGLLGMFGKRRIPARIASLSLLGLIVGGKAGLDLLKSESPDTAVLLLQFAAVIFFMEASQAVLSFEIEKIELVGKPDETSQWLLRRLVEWGQGQLAAQARIMAAALGLSLVLLVVGGFTGVSINQLAFSAGLVLLVVGLLLFLIMQKREPETAKPRLL